MLLFGCVSEKTVVVNHYMPMYPSVLCQDNYVEVSTSERARQTKKSEYNFVHRYYLGNNRVWTPKEFENSFVRFVYTNDSIVHLIRENTLLIATKSIFDHEKKIEKTTIE